MGNVIKFPGITKHDLPAQEMLKNIAEENPDNCFLIVWPNDGTDPTYHSTTGDTPVVLMRLQQFVHKFYNGDFDV